MTATVSDNNMCNSTSFKPFAAESNLTDGKDNDHEMDIPPPADAQKEETALQQLREKLDATPPEMKSSLVYAHQVSPDLINDDHLLGFLYAEKFDIDVSIKL